MAAKSYLVAAFPLPEVVFFPATILPLHIFEPRYRQMTADVLSGEGRLLVVQLRPGWEGDYHGNPPTYQVGCVGRIQQHEQLEDGRYNLMLVGLERVSIAEYVDAGPKPYRVARVVPAPETLSEPSKDQTSARLQLYRALEEWNTEQREQSYYAQFLKPELGLEALVNLGALILPFDAADRQELLELDRIDQRQLRVAAAAETLLTRARFCRRFRHLQPSDPRVN
jgi:hypothetical protein